MDFRHIARCAAVVVISSGLAFAHHSLAGVYDQSREITREGVITRFEFVNPHPFITIAVGTSPKETRPFTLELDNLSELTEIGVTTATFKPGDRVIVSGNPGREDQERIYVLRLDRPADGLHYEQVGYTPRIEKRPAQGTYQSAPAATSSALPGAPSGPLEIRR
ncbi:MAG TPA: DUF6152 family protein [Terriglobia bacterium]|nr:DUF6152 family protein [Terriglobia bacterium]